MNELTFTDIFIGSNGYVVLVSSMLIALLGNLFKKYKRFQSREDKDYAFSLKVWLRENTDDMVVGFFVTYILVRLIGFVAEYAFQAAGVSEHTGTLEPQDSIFLVSVLIGYYTDSLIDKLLK
jgi:hypothetical protein